MCMGCGVSKFDHEEAGAKFKRLTKRNVPHSNIENNGTLASEQLLHESDNNDRKSVSSWTGNKWEPDVRDPVNAKNKGGGVNAGGSKDQLGVYNKKCKVPTEEEPGGDGGGYTNSSERDKNEENGSFSDREDDIARPASPSFREYCVDSRDDFNEAMIGAKEETKKAQGSEVAEARKRRRSPGKGLIKSAMQRPAGWMQRQK